MGANASSNDKKGFRDLVDYQPVILKVIQDKKTLETLSDSNTYAVLSILRNGPMTVKEIEVRYNEPLNQKESDKRKEQEKNNRRLNYITKFNVKNKSDKTIYRYLNDLIKHDIVVHAGQRITEGQKVSEKLYMRTAKVFERKDMEWMSEKGEQWAEQFGLFMNLMTDGKSTSKVKCIQKFFNRWSEAKISSLEKLTIAAPEEFMDLISSKNWKEFAEFIDRVYLFGTLLNHPELLEELRDCFSN